MEKKIKQEKISLTYLVPVIFTNEWSRKYEEVKNDAKAVKNAKGGDKTDEGTLQIQLTFENHQKGHNVA